MPETANSQNPGEGLASATFSPESAFSMGDALHLFVVWHNASESSDRVEDDLARSFHLISSSSIEWSHDKFRDNISRFYGRKLPSIKQKIEHCGIGPLKLFLVQDDSPDYQVVDTSSGPQHVNLNAFKAKERYRTWTGGGHRIHATNNNRETLRDLSLLLGSDPINSLRNLDGAPLKRDLSGATGWSSFEELFTVMNACLSYVVLRNFAELHDGKLAEGHGDVDFLVDSLSEARQIMNAKPTFRQEFRRHHTIRVDNQILPIDLRNVGDNYYDEKWERDILKNRILEGQLYRPSEVDHYFSLLYHALVHKRAISDDYMQTFNNLRTSARSDLARWLVPDKLSAELDSFMNESSYKHTYPDDASVFYNLDYLRSSKRDGDRSIKLWPFLRVKVQARPLLTRTKRRAAELLPNRMIVLLKRMIQR